MATRNNKRNSAQVSNAATKQQVNNRKHNAPAMQAQDAPVPANVEGVESRLEDAKAALSKAKKAQRRESDKVADLKERIANESYALATLRTQTGMGDEADAVTIANRKVELGLDEKLAKAMSALPQDSDEVAAAKKEAKADEKSLTSAIAETKRQWGAHYRTLYATIGVTAQKQLTPALLKGLCPFLMVGSADGLKAGQVTKTAVRKNGKAVKHNGKRVYKYGLRERKGWSAYGLFELLELNYRWSEANVFTDDELKARTYLLNAQVSALRALKACKEAKKSDVPEVAYDADNRESELAAAAKAAAEAVKKSAAVSSKIA